jgi:nucleoside-diphosphate-sugar epimerase
MKIFLAGATGAMGKQLVPRLVQAGHEVVGTTRSESKRSLIEEMGAKAVVIDALNAEQVGDAVAKAEPDAIIHQLTAIQTFDIRRFDRSFAMTNRLRTEGTDHLLAAGRAVGVKRFVAQSYAAWPYIRTGGPVKTEEDPLDPNPPRYLRETLRAIVYLEEAVTGADWTEGIALRYGGFYGPGTSLGPDGGEQIELVRKRKFPIIGDGGGIWSFIHIADAAEGTVAALERGRRGIYNIVDDDPAPVSEWLPGLARNIGAPKPWRVPKFIGRLAAGEVGVVMMTDIRGASNEKAKRELGWTPGHPSWREGFGS